MHHDPRSDELLATEASAGNRAAFEVLVSRFAGAVLAVVERQVDDHHAALDAAQEIWIKVHRALPRYRPAGSFRSWLFSIALNHVRDVKRRGARARLVYLEDYRLLPEGAAVDQRGRSDEKAAIRSALDGVPEPFRTALTLVDVMSLTYEEAAAALGCALGTVKSRVNRGRFAFRDQYLKGGGDPGVRAAANRGPTP